MGNQLSIFQTTKLSRLLFLINENQEKFEYCNKSVSWFKEWIQDNLHIYNEFERHAFHLKREGKRDFYSARAIMEQMRWETLFKEVGSADYKINNNSIPYLSRLVMLENLELDGMFQLRRRGGPEDDTL